MGALCDALAPPLFDNPNTSLPLVELDHTKGPPLNVLPLRCSDYYQNAREGVLSPLRARVSYLIFRLVLEALTRQGWALLDIIAGSTGRHLASHAVFGLRPLGLAQSS